MSHNKIKLKSLDAEDSQRIEEVDYLIIGGGCAGLGLAVNFINSGVRNKKILVLEARSEYKRDKTWCSWAVYKHQFQDVVSKTWSKFQFISSDNRLILDSAKHPYQHINSLDYYKYALNLIANSSFAQVRMSACANTLRAQDDNVIVETNSGVISAKYVFDGRLPKPPDEKILQDKIGTFAVQVFLGVHIQLEEPFFNEHIATIMDSNISSDGVAFYYVLPFNSYEALIEPTFFLKSPSLIKEFTLDKLRSYIDDYLSKHHYFVQYKILYQEHDILHMIDFMTFEKHPHPRVYKIGTAAGLLQPGTAYAFTSIQRYNEKLVTLLKTGEFPEPPQGFSKFIKYVDNFSLRKLVKVSNPDEYLNTMIIPTWSPIGGDIYARFMHDALTSEDIEILSHSPSFALFL